MKISTMAFLSVTFGLIGAMLYALSPAQVRAAASGALCGVIASMAMLGILSLLQLRRSMPRQAKPKARIVSAFKVSVVCPHGKALDFEYCTRCHDGKPLFLLGDEEEV